MARVIGFRAEAKQVHWAVVEGTSDAPILVAHQKEAAPTSEREEPRSLAWYRARIRDVLELYKPETAAVRFPESTAKGANKDGAKRRLRIEGILLEASQSWGCNASGTLLQAISSRLEVKSAKPLLENDDFRGVDWSAVSKEAREAILAAVAALPLGGFT